MALTLSRLDTWHQKSQQYRILQAVLVRSDAWQREGNQTPCLLAHILVSSGRLHGVCEEAT